MLHVFVEFRVPILVEITMNKLTKEQEKFIVEAYLYYKHGLNESRVPQGTCEAVALGAIHNWNAKKSEKWPHTSKETFAFTRRIMKDRPWFHCKENYAHIIGNIGTKERPIRSRKKQKV